MCTLTSIARMVGYLGVIEAMGLMRRKRHESSRIVVDSEIPWLH